MSFLRTLLLLALAAGAAAAADAPARPLPRTVLTNAGIVVLAEAGLSEGFLLDMIATKNSRFDTSADALADLARQGLSERVLRAMVRKQDPPPEPSPAVSSGIRYLTGRVVKRKFWMPTGVVNASAGAADGPVALYPGARVPEVALPEAPPAPDPTATRVEHWYRAPR